MGAVQYTISRRCRYHVALTLRLQHTFTSRAEYRLLRRQDNVDRQLSEAADELGSITADRRVRFKQNMLHLNIGLEMLTASRVDGVAGDVMYTCNLPKSSLGK